VVLDWDNQGNAVYKWAFNTQVCYIYLLFNYIN
jgi:hypothetical protein